MKNIKLGALFLGLTLALLAVSVAAQERRVRPQVDVFRAFNGLQLGISVSDTANGVRVDTVHAATPAEKAGFREGDLVVEFDGERVRSAMQLTRLVHETPEGRQVAVAVMRDGKRQTLQATPDNGASSDGAAMMRGDVMRELERKMYDDQPRRFEYRLPERFEYRIPEGLPFMGSRGRLGVTIQSLTPDLEEYFGAKNGGALVSSVARDSAAAKAGVKAGDVIISVDGRQISDSDDLMRELRALKGEITIVLLRDRKEMTLKATLTDEPKGSSPRVI